VVKTELIFFLTPSIISGEESVGNARSPLATDEEEQKE
jgi:hypothetical protein